MTNFLSYARGPLFMGRKLVRDNELLQSGGLLSFPRTGCALRAPVSLSRGRRSRHYGRTSATAQGSSSLRARELPDGRGLRAQSRQPQKASQAYIAVASGAPTRHKTEGTRFECGRWRRNVAPSHPGRPKREWQPSVLWWISGGSFR
jgi:hypothetical protein